MTVEQYRENQAKKLAAKINSNRSKLVGSNSGRTTYSMQITTEEANILVCDARFHPWLSSLPPVSHGLVMALANRIDQWGEGHLAAKAGDRYWDTLETMGLADSLTVTRYQQEIKL